MINRHCEEHQRRSNPIWIAASAFGLLAMMLFSTAIQAAEYKPGSIGYLYNQCGLALQNSESAAALYNTVCGAFTEGFVAGLMASNNVTLSPPRPNDPCAAEKKKEYERINARFCAHLPEYDQKKIEAGRALDAATGLVTNWISYLQAHRKKGQADPLRAPVVARLGDILRPGEFCNSLENIEPPEKKFVVHPALLNITWNDAMAIKKNMTLAKKYEQCLKDIQKTFAPDFFATRCGAEISGYIAGVHSTAHLQHGREKPSAACGKEIDRLYKSLNVSNSMCVNMDTAPRSVAKIFINRIRAMQMGEKTLPDTEAFGAIGYQTIYKGFLCVKD